MKIDTFLASVGGLAIVLLYAFLRYSPMIIAFVVVTHFIVKWW